MTNTVHSTTSCSNEEHREIRIGETDCRRSFLFYYWCDDTTI